MPARSSDPDPTEPPFCLHIPLGDPHKEHWRVPGRLCHWLSRNIYICTRGMGSCTQRRKDLASPTARLAGAQPLCVGEGAWRSWGLRLGACLQGGAP